ncbi:hypothetical protein QYE76_020664 [Lolium multiflorum]|uniref:Uncharacterized protein n=1 Tax=Lolium multiflorum TaxID=4521 RepID=A0AAD8R7G8_LOLMU|nr:hypothetical protein QYE76_020656 [Lolium multiflorum]KAK1615147.1 hypothetical protein QYE76_020664 [Lolium multiflorum]
MMARRGFHRALLSLPKRCRSLGGLPRGTRIGARVPAGPHPVELQRPHLLLADAGHPRPRREAQAAPRARLDRRQDRGGGGRLPGARPADTTPSKIVQLLRSAGAREVHMRIASPPVVGSCLYIINNSSDGELIPNQMGLDGARQLIGSDSLLSSRSTCCTVYTARRQGTTASDACFSRKYPLMPTLTKLSIEFDEEDRMTLWLSAVLALAWVDLAEM